MMTWQTGDDDVANEGLLFLTGGGRQATANPMLTIPSTASHPLHQHHSHSHLHRNV
jgi:hypothetical protein